MSNQKAALIILDGWGHGPDNPEVNAIKKAQTPYVDSLYKDFPNSELLTSGENVGLPEGQMGNSEVGHLNIGAGRVVYQPLVRINKAIEERMLHNNNTLTQAINYAKTNGKSIHLLGLLSDGGVHSHIDHLKGLIDIFEEQECSNVYVHAFTDGRDTDPKSGIGYIQSLQQHLSGKQAELASIVGRYYAMDRDNRWERIQKAYKLLVEGRGSTYQDPAQALMDAYEADNTDEFIEPVILTHPDEQPIATINNGDVVLFFNFRTDRGRELTKALTQVDMPEHDMQKMDLHYLTMTPYDKTFEGIQVIFDEDIPDGTLGEAVANEGLSQLRIAETEKYPHVTYFFSGGREETFTQEQRKMIASPQVPTYDLQPPMSAHEVNAGLREMVQTYEPSLVVLNYANPDMVGHTGEFDAVVNAIETVDHCLKETVEYLKEHNYSCLITADHGNADYMVNPDGSPNTAHTKHPVPIFLVNTEKSYKLVDGILADIAPTILKLMGKPATEEMQGRCLLVEEN